MKWTKEEDTYLVRKMTQSDNFRETSKILTAVFPGRTAIAIERRWYILRKKTVNDIEKEVKLTFWQRLKTWFKH